MKMTPSQVSSWVGDGGAVGEVIAALDRVDQDGGADQSQHHIPPADAVAEPHRHRKQHEAQHQHEGDVRVAQRLRRDDGRPAERPGAGDGGVEMKQRHHHRDGGGDVAGGAGQAVERALVGLDELFGLFQRSFGNARRIARQGRNVPLRHRSPLLADFCVRRRPLDGKLTRRGRTEYPTYDTVGSPGRPLMAIRQPEDRHDGTI